MALISGYHQSLERNVKTEVVLDKIKMDSRNGSFLKDYINIEQLRAYTPATTYDVYLETKLRQLTSKLFSEISVNSAARDIVQNKQFKEIVAYGEAIVPHILNSLKREPSILIWALNSILNSKISNKPLSIQEASNEWIKWGKNIHLV
jgi:hypothetical protein